MSTGDKSGTTDDKEYTSKGNSARGHSSGRHGGPTRGETAKSLVHIYKSNIDVSIPARNGAADSTN